MERFVDSDNNEHRPWVYENGEFDILTDGSEYYRVYVDRFEKWRHMVGGINKHIHIDTYFV